MIVLLFTGGTISMRHDSGSRGAVPALKGADLVALAPGIDRIARIEIEEWATMAASHLTVSQAWSLRTRIAELVARPDVEGIVVTHGTDTLEESAYLTARSIRTEKPVVFTGAMRTSSDLSWDGPANLTDSVRVAACPRAGAYGVVVVFGGRIFTAADVTKVHTHSLDAFESPGLGPVGVVDSDAVIFRRALVPGAPPLTPPHPAEPVDIVYAYEGADARLLDAARPGAPGVVVAAFGRGNMPLAMYDGVSRWLAEGKPAVITSRAARGRVAPTYGFPGGGRSLADAGAILAGARRPQQARIDLMLALGAGLQGDKLAEVFAS